MKRCKITVLKTTLDRQLADLIGVTRQTINAIETNRFVPSTLLALKLSAVFKKSVNELFTLEHND